MLVILTAFSTRILSLLAIISGSDIVGIYSVKKKKKKQGKY